MKDRRVTVWLQRFGDRPTLQLQWIDPGTGRRRTRTAGTADRKEAEKARSDWEYELNHGMHQQGTHIAWAAFRELFEAEFLASRRPNTGLKYARTFNLFEEISRPARLAGITERVLSTFAAALLRRPCRGREGMAAKTIFLHVSLMGAALRWAQRQRLLAEVPRLPSIKVPKRHPRAVPTDAWERVYQQAPDQQTRTYLLCAWRAGLRLSEALALEWDEAEEAPWLDVNRDRIVFPARFVKAVEDQTVPLDAELRAALGALPRQGPKVFCFLGRGNRPIGFKAVSRRIVLLARAAGVKLSYHTLRRGFCSYYAARVPAPVLTRLTRNTLAVAMAYYVDVDQAAADAVRQRDSSCNTPLPESRPTAEKISLSTDR